LRCRPGARARPRPTGRPSACGGRRRRRRTARYRRPDRAARSAPREWCWIWSGTVDKFAAARRRPSPPGAARGPSRRAARPSRRPSRPSARRSRRRGTRAPRPTPARPWGSSRSASGPCGAPGPARGLRLQARRRARRQNPDASTSFVFDMWSDGWRLAGLPAGSKKQAKPMGGQTLFSPSSSPRPPTLLCTPCSSSQRPLPHPKYPFPAQPISGHQRRTRSAERRTAASAVGASRRAWPRGRRCCAWCR
jgi:hypothetical protein